jgi:uncharacterized protein YbjQ (UPF0145 family)
MLISLLISYGWPVLLLTTGWAIGRINIRNHLKRLDAQTEALSDIRLHNIKYKPGGPFPIAEDSFLVTGSLVLSIDVFRQLIAGFMQITGGDVKNYSELLERGRRDALLRLKANAQQKGAQDIYNIKVQSAAISGSRSIEILAYGTAVKS